MRKICVITINGKALQEILDAHKIWRYTDATEGRADLSGAVLRDADLRAADLSGAVLSGAVLSRAVLSRADLSGADLSGADLSRANLSGANLSGAVLSRADLSGAVLSGADLREAVLRDAVLSGANLSGAVLSGANLSGAKSIPDVVRDVTCILPDGPIIGWKKCENNIIVKMQIPAKAKRSNATGRKCRAEFVKVLQLFDGNGKKMSDDAFAISQCGSTEYRKGQTVKPDSFDENRWEECSHGIHFFITRLEAEIY